MDKKQYIKNDRDEHCKELYLVEIVHSCLFQKYFTPSSETPFILRCAMDLLTALQRKQTPDQHTHTHTHNFNHIKYIH